MPFYYFHTIMRAGILTFLILLLFASCSVQKRHYLKGFYIERISSETKPATTSKHAYQEYLCKHTAQKHKPAITSEKNEILALNTSSEKKNIPHVKKQKKISFSHPEEKVRSTTKEHEPKDEHLNSVAKASFRMSLYSLLFLLGGLYLFFELSSVIYIVIGLFIIAFIFALVSVISSASAQRDKIATDKKGRHYARFALVLSLLIMAAIAVFFIFTPLIL